jgi:hypothetical protein
VRTTVPSTMVNMGSPVFREVCLDVRTGSQTAQGPNAPRDLAVHSMLPLACRESGDTLEY